MIGPEWEAAQKTYKRCKTVDDNWGNELVDRDEL